MMSNISDAEEEEDNDDMQWLRLDLPMYVSRPSEEEVGTASSRDRPYKM